MKNLKDSFRRFVRFLENSDLSDHDGYWLPNIQRPFVWKEEQIERFFDSILREYPIGTLLIWKTNSKIKRRRFIDNYKKDIRLTDFYVPEDSKPKMLVLDGQQRLQSLFIGLKGSFDKKELCLNVLSGDQTAPEDIRYKFKFLLSSEIKAPWFKLKDIVFSNNGIYEETEYINARFDTELSNDEKEKVSKIVSKIQKIFTSEDGLAYQVIDSIDNSELYSEDDIVEIFIRANSGGTPLGKSDLLFSLLTSSWDKADEQMEDLLKALNKTGFEFSRDFVLKACLSIFGKGAAYRVEKFRDVKTRKCIIDNWNKISEAIRDVKDFIYRKTFIKTNAILPSYSTLIPLIYFRYHYKDKWNTTNNIQEYLLRTLLTSAFSGSSDTLIDRCTKKIEELNDFNISEIFGIMRADGRNLEISKDDIFNTYYGSKQIHLLFNLCYDFDYLPAYEQNKPQVDHIFPQSQLNGIKVANPTTGKMDVQRYSREQRDQIANCMLLTAQENGAGGKTDILPEIWFADKSQEYLDMHLIPRDKELWKLENFEQFIEERKKLIEAKFKDIILIERLDDSVKMPEKGYNEVSAPKRKTSKDIRLYPQQKESDRKPFFDLFCKLFPEEEYNYAWFKKSGVSIKNKVGKRSVCLFENVYIKDGELIGNLYFNYFNNRADVLKETYKIDAETCWNGNPLVRNVTGREVLEMLNAIMPEIKCDKQ